jgi:hypothetical protein|tara:strand:+ start:608 stop:1873 length:1266 start_codon:yes stop_codon:yes gene_type:complete
MSVTESVWWPAAMRQIESDSEAPEGFEHIIVAGIGMKAEFIEPIDASDWNSMIAGLESWGNFPKGEVIIEETISTDRGLVLKLSSSGKLWCAEFLPWGSDGRLRARISLSPESNCVPSGGFVYGERDVILVREWTERGKTANNELETALQSNDFEVAKNILFRSATALGRYHSAAESGRVTPPDPQRWNKRMEGLEARLRANTIWRAPHTKQTMCMPSLGDVRFSDLQADDDGEYEIRIGPPRLADCLAKPNCEFPAIRDFASLLHGLNRLHYDSRSQLILTDLRSSLIEGWKSTAPPQWCSEKAFYTPRGGVFFWEYEQMLLDVLEAVSHQSGKPEPAVSIIRYVPSMQKSMFNSRILAAFSYMFGFFSASSLYQVAIGNSTGIILPVAFAFAIFSFGFFYYYKKSAPPPEKPIFVAFKD